MAKQVDINKKKKAQKRKDYTPYIIIGTLAVVAVLIVILTQIKPKIKVNVPEREKATITEGMTMGDPNAKVKVIEFADFQCPYCSVYWAQLEPAIISEYVNTGKVFFTYSPFSFLGSYVANNPWDESIKSSEAAFCANEQGYFWEYRDLLFANQNGENAGGFSEENLITFAENTDMNMKSFKECFTSGKYNQAVLDANTYAAEQGVNYSPAFIVDGQIVSANDLQTAIETALSK